MQGWKVLVIASLSLQCAIAQAHTTTAASVPSALSGLDAKEADALIAKLEAAQRGLRAGEFQTFELLAGSVASYEMTNVSPRDAFLKVPFGKVWTIERIGTDSRYKMAYAPDGFGKLYWEIEVVLNSAGTIDRVLMLHKPPAPF